MEPLINTKGAPLINQTAISPYENFCDGFVSPGARGLGYINAAKVEVGKAPMTEDFLLDGIVAYDMAEASGPYIGQINMITASSFSGVAGQFWGYDLAQHEAIKDGSIKELGSVMQYDDTPMKVYDARPLIEAAAMLFGTVNYDKDQGKIVRDNRRYPLAPGAHTICANKGVTAYRPRTGEPKGENQAYGVWSYISIAFARERNKYASCFIEDCGLWMNDNQEEFDKFMLDHVQNVSECTVACGSHNGILFDRAFVGFAYTMLDPGEVGTAITVGPYFTLAQNAVPKGGFDCLNDMTLLQWLNEQKERFPRN